MVDTVPSLAVLLDEIRPLIAQARERGERPRYVLLSKEAYDAVSACRRTDRERGMPITVLGMEAVPAERPLDRPRVF
jgi:hypothetical protein